MGRRSMLKTAVVTGQFARAVRPILAQHAKLTAPVLNSEMSYVDVGSGRPIVFVQGSQTSSYLGPNTITDVTHAYRVIAPDMIGMGDSGKPDIAYTYQDHESHLVGLLERPNLQNAVVVTHDWGSALGFHHARTRPDRSLLWP